MVNNLGRRCACGNRALPGNELCFGCMEDKVLRASHTHIHIDETRDEMLTPGQKKLKGQGAVVRTRWDTPAMRRKDD